MLIPEEELRYWSRRRVPEVGVSVFLWQHSMSARQLLDYAHIHAPLLSYARYEALSEKRLCERLSIDLLLSRLMGCEVIIAHNDLGAPELVEAGREDLYLLDGDSGEDSKALPLISISHSANLYALSFGYSPHGIDIESWGAKALRVVGKFISAHEESLLDALLPRLGSPKRVATMLWSAKEAAYKCFGHQGLDFREDLQINLAVDGRLAVYLPRFEKSGIITVEIYPDCVLTRCEAR